MKFSSLFLAEHATVTNGLINVLNGGVNQVFRPSLPAPLGLVCVGLVVLPEDFVSGNSVPVRVAITSMDETEVYARIEGAFGIELAPGIEPIAATSPIVIGMEPVLLPRPGLFKLTANLDEAEPVSIVFNIVVVPIELGPLFGTTPV